MGYIEDVQAMNLSDEDKQVLIEAHRKEVDPLKESNKTLNARSKKETVEAEVVALGDAGFEEAPGLLAYFRRCLLSDDAEEPGAVLLSDNDMGLSGDLATGATGRESVSVASALRKFVELMPRTEEGKLRIALSDQGAATDNHGRPGTGGGDERTDEEKATEHAERVGRLAGRPIERTRKRYQRHATITAGGE